MSRITSLLKIAYFRPSLRVLPSTAKNRKENAPKL